MSLLIERESFGTTEQKALERWIGSGEVPLVEKHVRGLIAEQQAIAANEMLGAEDRPNQKEAAENAITKARQYQAFLSVLEELKKATKFGVVTIKHE